MAGTVPPRRGATSSSHGAVSAQLEAVLRPLFLQAAVEDAAASGAAGGGAPVRLLRSSAPGVVSVEFSGDLTQWIVDVCGGGGAYGAVQEVAGRLLNERLEEERRKSRGSVGPAEAVAWLREVAANVYGQRSRDGRWGFACWHEVLDARRGLWLGKGGALQVRESRGGDDEEDDSPSERTISKSDKWQKSDKRWNEIQLAYTSCEKIGVSASKNNYSFTKSVSCCHHKKNAVVKCKVTEQVLRLEKQRRKASELPRRGYSNCRRKRARIGCSFQADVPIWIGSTDRSLSQSDAKDLSDSKWLGTRLWPLEGDNGEKKKELVRSCLKMYSHAHSRSVMSNRDNIRMARNELRSELGEAFDLMGFNNMGEEVSYSWNWKEQLVFDYLVRKNPIAECKTFSYAAFRCFPSRTKQDIVSYYFNVHVLRRMSFQTKLATEAVDSDDDEWSEWSYEELPACTEKRSTGIWSNNVSKAESLRTDQG